MGLKKNFTFKEKNLHATIIVIILLEINYKTQNDLFSYQIKIKKLIVIQHDIKAKSIE